MTGPRGDTAPAGAEALAEAAPGDAAPGDAAPRRLPGERGPSLKARALRLLAQREYSRLELRRKLLLHAAGAGCRAADGVTGDAAAGAANCPDRLLDWLEVHGYLCDGRFVESRVHARAARFGTARIRQELAQHGVKLAPGQLEALQSSEFDRAAAVWRRRFSVPASDAAGRARQTRFLAGRGFSHEVIRRIVRAPDE